MELSKLRVVLLKGAFDASLQLGKTDLCFFDEHVECCEVIREGILVSQEEGADNIGLDELRETGSFNRLFFIESGELLESGVQTSVVDYVVWGNIERVGDLSDGSLRELSELDVLVAEEGDQSVDEGLAVFCD